MRSVSQQIGWSQEAKLYYEWLVQLERLTAILGKNNVPTTSTTTTVNPNKFITLDWLTDASAGYWLSQNGAGTDPTNVDNWNIAFNLPALGTPFTSVTALFNNSRIILSNLGNINDTPYRLFSPNGTGYSNDLISIVDEGVLLHIGDSCFRNNTNLVTASFAEVIELYADSPFSGCENLVTVIMPKLAYTNYGGFEYCISLQLVDFPELTHITENLFYGSGLMSINAPLAEYIGDSSFGFTQLSVANFPNATYVGYRAFENCPLDNVDLSSCTNLGGSVGDDLVFTGITGKTIILTVPEVLMTCNSGDPDGDIQYLQANNTVIIDVSTTRKSFINLAQPIFRGGLQTDINTWWSGNTVANVTATNPGFEITGLKTDNGTVPIGWDINRTVAPSVSGPFDTIAPNYTDVDFRGVPILNDLESLYKFTKKIATDSFMASRNPVVKIYRASLPQASIPIDGWFMLCIDFDATGNERDGYDYTIFEYPETYLPVNIPFPFTYGPYLSNTVGPIIDSNISMNLQQPTTDWVLGVTNILGWTIEEEFPIPPAWG